MKHKTIEAPILNGGEELVLDTLCKHHMLQIPYKPNRVAFRCKIPVWVIEKSLHSLIKRGLVKKKSGQYMPLMQINGAPVPKPSIRYVNGIKIIECPPRYAVGYAIQRLLPERGFDEE